MAEYPPVIALIVTYRRLRLALETIRSVKERVIYPNIGFHIADDGSGPEYVQTLRDEIGGNYSIEVTDAGRAGVGASMNLGIKAIIDGRADLWLHLEDDWVLPGPLDLAPCVQLLQEDESVGMIRLGRLTADETAHTMAWANKLWWRLVKDSATYVFSGNAAIRHKRFALAYGPYETGLTPGLTELAMCDVFNRKPGPDIVYPAWLSYDQTFQHIGDNQSFKWYMENEGRSADDVAAMFEEQDRAR